MMKKEEDSKPGFLLTSAMPGLVLLGIMWGAWLLSFVGIFEPGHWGIRPRELRGLWGILSSPLFHGGFGHLLANTFPFFFLSTALFFFYRKAAWQVLIMGWVMTGLWVWIAGRPQSSHIGASGLVYMFAAFIFFSGIFRRDAGSIALSLVVIFIYGGMVWGILPLRQGVSWESHLFGGVAGAMLAWFLKDLGAKPKKKYSWQDEPDSSPGDENAPWYYKKEFVKPQEEE